LNKFKSKLRDFLNKHSPKGIFLVTGKKSFDVINNDISFMRLLNDYNFIRFFDFEINPKIEDVKRGVEIFNNNSCDLIISLGGGSVMDMAKLINFYSKKTVSITNLNDDIKKDDLYPNIAIPTTAGSGSESTHFAVVYSDNKKYSCANLNLIPNEIILEPHFLKSLSPYQLACSGMDALSQAIEAYWNVNSNTESDKLALKALGLLWNNLAEIYNNKDNFKDVMLGSNLAGKAINITKTTAPHAVSYPFTTFFNIPHGHSVSLTLNYFLNYNYNLSEEDCNDTRGAKYVKNKIENLAKSLRFDDVKNFSDALDNLLKNLNLCINLNKLNISNRELIDHVIPNINYERVKNNPRKLNKENLINFFNEN
tara:strand:- start:808 stop:1908 length:1101 start_codon:yes stop_codon:yes gene_type:complete